MTEKLSEPLTFTGVMGSAHLEVALAGKRLIRISASGEVDAPNIEAANEAGRVFVESIRHNLARSTEEAVIEKLVALITNDDHKRLCEGRQYTCTCGYDDKVQVAALEAARKQG